MTREMERTELIAREGIRDLVARYTWAGDQGRTDDVAQCFMPDGILDVGQHGGTWTGRGEIARELGAVADRVIASGEAPTRVNHHVSSVLIDVTTPTSATVRSYFCVFTDDGADHWGSYRDEVVMDPIDGQWRFAHRSVRVTGTAATSRFVTSA